ncbi:hypothetical protein V6Z12_D10G058600 [Gossypium hirsutum]
MKATQAETEFNKETISCSMASDPQQVKHLFFKVNQLPVVRFKDNRLPLPSFLARIKSQGLGHSYRCSLNKCIDSVKNFSIKISCNYCNTSHLRTRIPRRITVKNLTVQMLVFSIFDFHSRYELLPFDRFLHKHKGCRAKLCSKS